MNRMLFTCLLAVSFSISIAQPRQADQSSDWEVSVKPQSQVELKPLAGVGSATMSNPLQAKDYIAVGAAIISLFSLLISYITWKQKDKEAKRTIRNQLTDAVSKLDGAMAEWDKLIFESAGQQLDSYYFGKRSYLNGQKRFLARQTLFLLEHIPELVSDFEYNRIADAFSSIGDYEESNPLYQKAIAIATSPAYKSASIRGYAKSLFNQNKLAEGRDKFREALNLINEHSDFQLYIKGETYRRWAALEMDYQEFESANSLLDKAKDLCSRINHPYHRNQGLAAIAALERQGLAKS
jgi:tetratricopeptide (TPR) repeat protein